MKKTLTGLFAVFAMVIFILMAANNNKVSAETDGNYQYEIVDGNAVITGFNGDGYTGLVEIPSEVGGHPVVKIGSRAFYSKSYITTVTLPDTVTEIESSAFEFCSGLVSVKLGNSVGIIGEKAFYTCKELKSIEIPDSVTEIGEQAFFECSQMSGVKLGGSVKIIGYYAFASCSSLKSIVIPDSVTEIRANAFRVSNLEKITFGKSLCSVGENAFYKTPWYDAQPDGLVYAGNVAYDYKGVCPSEIVIKEGTAGIAGSAFKNNNDIKSLVIPDSVTTVGHSAFYNCAGLSEISFGSSLKSIDEYAFDGTAWYDAQPDGVVYAGKVVYKYKGVYPDSITVKEGTVAVAAGAFAGYYNNMERQTFTVTVPSSVKTIGYEAFKDFKSDEYSYRKCFKLIVAEGSYAEEYAKENSYNYEIDESMKKDTGNNGSPSDPGDLSVGESSGASEGGETKGGSALTVILIVLAVIAAGAGLFFVLKAKKK